MKILLIKHIHHLCEDCCSGKRTYVFSSLMFQTAWFLKKHGIDVDVIDLEIDQEIDYGQYNLVVGFIPLISGFYEGVELLTKSRKAGATTVLFLQSFLGVFEAEIMTDFPEVDFAILMEDRELTLLDLIKHLSDKENTSLPSAGIVYRDSSGEIIVTPKRKAEKDLSHLTSAIEIYEKATLFRYTRGYVTVGRGCPHPCSFCAMRATRPRKRPVEAVTEELDFLSRNMHSFELVDPDITNKPDWITELSEKLVQKNVRISWIADSRAEYLKDIEMLRLLRYAGCYRLAIGVESLTTESPTYIGKGNTLEDVELAAENCKKVGIIPNFNFMVGFWWDSNQTLRLIEDFFKRHPKCYAFVQMVRPHKGTPLYSQFLEKGLMREKTYKDYITSTEQSITPTLYLSKDEVFKWYQRLKLLGNNAPLLSDIKDLGMKGVFKTVAAEGFFNIGRQVINRIYQPKIIKLQ